MLDLSRLFSLDLDLVLVRPSLLDLSLDLSLDRFSRLDRPFDPSLRRSLDLERFLDRRVDLILSLDLDLDLVFLSLLASLVLLVVVWFGTSSHLVASVTRLRDKTQQNLN